MTDQDRAENARILLSHSEIKPQFFAGRSIADLYEIVERVQGPTVEEREPCQDCFDSGEILVRGAESNYVEVIKCEHGKGAR